MASQVEINTLVAEYPVAGVDNDTQGFRDNFSIIKSVLSSSNAEIESLQNNTAKLNETNNFRGEQINDAELSNITKRSFDQGSALETGININFSNGHYQSFKVNCLISQPITLNLTSWPERNGLAKMTIAIEGSESDGTSEVRTVIIVSDSAEIKKSPNFPATLTIDSVTNKGSPVIIEFWTVNQGATVFANYLGTFS